MGLAERKAIALVKTTDFAAFVAGISELTGAELQVEFSWEVLEAHTDCVWICEKKKHNDNMFHQVMKAFATICSDSMGKDAVKSAVKGLKLIPASGDLDFKDGILTVRSDLGGNGVYSADQIQAVLEKSL